MIIHEHEHILIASSVRPLKGSDDVTMYKTTSVRGFVSFASMGDVSCISFRTVFARGDVSSGKATRSIRSELGETLEVFGVHVQSPVHDSSRFSGWESGDMRGSLCSVNFSSQASVLLLVLPRGAFARS